MKLLGKLEHEKPGNTNDLYKIQLQDLWITKFDEIGAVK